MQGRFAIAGVARRIAVALVACLLCGSALAADPHLAARRALIAELQAQSAGATDADTRIAPAVLDILGRVPRHAFVPPAGQDEAYANRPLAIGYGQTISQPYIVALMTTLARPQPGARILEIGTGSGSQAAVLAEAGAEVYTIEIIAPLAAQAKQRLRAYPRVATRTGDGYYGWKEHAPFDAIVVTAAASSVPPPLLAQLRPGGRMVIPVGSSFLTQTLLLVQKDEAGRVRTRQILPVRFVPLTGEH